MSEPVNDPQAPGWPQVTACGWCDSTHMAEVTCTCKGPCGRGWCPRREPRAVSVKVLDLCCGIGGVASGYDLAGCEVTGVDVVEQPDYPFAFLRADALAVLADAAFVAAFDLLHASFPCQGYSAPTVGTNAKRGKAHPRLVASGRAMLEATGKPFVLENVAGSPVRKDAMLCGEMFGLPLLMHRWFEFGGGLAPMPTPVHPRHRGRVRGWRHGEYFDGPYLACYGKGGGKATVAEMQAAKGIGWSADHLGLRDALPVAYGQALGAHVRAQLEREAAA